MITILVEADTVEEAKAQKKRCDDSLKCIDTFESGGDIIITDAHDSSSGGGCFSIILGIERSDMEVEMRAAVEG